MGVVPRGWRSAACAGRTPGRGGLVKGALRRRGRRPDGLTTQVVNQSSTSGNGGYQGGLTYSSGSLNSTSLATVTSDLVTSLDSYSYSDLHEDGGDSSGGGFSLGCVRYDADGLSSYSQQQYQTQNAAQTLVVTGNQCLTMMGQPVGPGGVGASTASATASPRPPATACTPTPTTRKVPTGRAVSRCPAWLTTRRSGRTRPTPPSRCRRPHRLRRQPDPRLPQHPVQLARLLPE